jgi:uncharacterized integral membrane protein
MDALRFWAQQLPLGPVFLIAAVSGAAGFGLCFAIIH